MANDKLEIYKCIAAVAACFANNPIGKNRKNVQQGYAFRGIDDIFNALAFHLASYGLLILPRCISREVTERINKTGTALFYVTVEMEFDFVATIDGSKHTVRMYGEAMDSGDKATNKAMSAAYKYAVIQTFCIPTEGDNDSDASTHEVKPKSSQNVPTPIRRRDPQAETTSSDTKEALLSADQVAQIKSLCELVGKPPADIATAYKKASIDFIEARYFDAIVKRLNDYKGRNDD